MLAIIYRKCNLNLCGLPESSWSEYKFYFYLYLYVSMNDIHVSFKF